jgi:proline iminopeptidase
VKVDVGGARIWFDVEGAKLVADGPRMRERPTLLLLHGGPGFDHSYFKPSHTALTDVAQVIYLDHRGNGRSDYSTPDKWNLAQWADDLRAFIEALGIERPVILGLSFGGFVAQSFALRHPAQIGKLILASTAAKFRTDRVLEAFGRMHGAAARELAAAFWGNATDPDIVQRYIDICFPLYNPTPRDPDMAERSTFNPAMLAHFFRDGGEGYRFDFRPRLKEARCPTLVLAGDLDPVTTIEDAEDMVAALPSALTRFERFPGCGHGVHRDQPERAFKVIREFVQAGA